MGRVFVPSRLFSLPVAALAAVIGFSVSMGASAGPPPADLPKAAPAARPMGEAAEREIQRQWSLENNGCRLVGGAWDRRDRISMQLAITFDQAVKEHAAGTAALAWLKRGEQAPERQNRDRPPFYEGFRTLSGSTLYQSQAMENCVKRLLATGSSEEVAVCLKVAQGYLNYDKPQYRAVACEFLSHFPLQMIDEGLLEGLSKECREDLRAHLPRQIIEEGLLPAVARRLGDTAKAFDGANFVMECRQQSTLMTPSANRVSVSVADVARQALALCTEFKFQDARTFDVWWRGYGNKDCRHRLWYWTVRWNSLPFAASPPPAVSNSMMAVVTPAPSRISVETEFPALVAALGADEGLKTLLLATNPAVAVQSGAKYMGNPSWNTKVAADAPEWVGPQGPRIEPKVVAKFVQQYSLKPRILDLLRQDQPWPEVVTIDSKAGLLAMVIEVLEIMATPADAAAIGQALDRPLPSLTTCPELGLQRRLTLLLTTLAPEKAEQILLPQLQRDPRDTALAAELIRITGLKHWDILAPAARDPYVRAELLPSLGRLRTPQAARILDELLAGENLKAELPRIPGACLKEMNDGNRLGLFDAYVRAATLLNGNRPVVGRDLLDRATGVASKIRIQDKDSDLAREEEEHNRGVPAARAEAVDKLKKFFDWLARPEVWAH